MAYDFLGPWNQHRADEILNSALAYNGFTPGPGDCTCLVIRPDHNGQISLITICLGENHSETAWGAGTQFPGPNWAMYITYNG